jgi:hypothetical protein
MTLTTALCLAALCAPLLAANQKESRPVIACNPRAIRALDRPRHAELAKRVRASAKVRREIKNGYAFTLDGSNVTLPHVAEWISMERLCCPFLMLQISASGEQSDWVLTITGPEGVKPLSRPSFRSDENAPIAGPRGSVLITDKASWPPSAAS